MEPDDHSDPRDAGGVREVDHPDDGELARRLRRNTRIALGLMLAASLILSTRRVFLGVLLGGALGLFNQRWLEGSVRAILAAAASLGSGRVPPWTASKLVLRYFIVAIVFGAATMSGYFHPLGLGLGLSSYVAGVMIEAGYQIVLVFRSDRS